jgi:hypothetical protein
VLCVLGFAVPIASYFWLIARYGVNAIYADQLSDLNLVERSYSGTLSFSTLWAQHNENRVLFPNLIVLAIGRTTHLNIIVELYVSAVMLIAAVALLIVTHKRRSPGRRWMYYCPVAILMFSLVQDGNTLWGFQMAWYLVLLCLAVAVFFLDTPSPTWLTYAAAIAAAVVGSFSSLQGLLIWPVGLILLYYRRRSLRVWIAWLSTAVVAVVLYFHNYDPNLGVPYHAWAIEHPFKSIQFFLTAIGDVVGVPVSYASSNPVLPYVGILILILAVYAVVRTGARKDETSPAPLGVVLIFFGILFALTITEGRAILGEWQASASRYTTYDLLVPVGIYMALLGRPAEATAAQRTPSRLAQHLSSFASRFSLVRSPTWWRTTVFRAVWVVLLGLICVQAVMGVVNGLRDSQVVHRQRVAAADMTVNASQVPGTWLAAEFYFLAQPHSGDNVSKLDHLFKLAAEDHLSLYSTNEAAMYRHEGLFPWLPFVHHH